MSHDTYTCALAGRYASDAMKRLWSDDTKFQTWRQLWTHLAQIQQKLGLAITDEQIQQMQANLTTIDYQRAGHIEKKIRHDVMAHAQVFGEAAPLAAPIIHLGATSCDITDNAELIQLKRGLTMMCQAVARIIDRLRSFAREYRDLPTLGFTHFQPAQPTTVGKRAAMWGYDLLHDLTSLEETRDRLLFRGIKGTTGTQASFLELFDGDHAKVEKLDELFTKACGFTRSVALSGQTYTRKQDTRILNVLADFGDSAHKIGTDLRLLQHDKGIEEPYEEDQVGSSAMAYKRNPMRSERMCSLANHLTALPGVARTTHATQWLERTLDDSAARRLIFAQGFLGADAIARLMQNVFERPVVYHATIQRHLREELPFMMTETLLMAMVKADGNRQECHERIRQHSQVASRRVKAEGAANDLIERIRNDEYFAPIHSRLDKLTDPRQFIGRAPEQVDEFVALCDHSLTPYRDQLHEQSQLNV